MLKTFCGLFLAMTILLAQAECTVAGVEHEKEFFVGVEKIKALDEYKQHERYLSSLVAAFGSTDIVIFEGDVLEQKTTGGSKCYWSVMVYDSGAEHSSPWGTFYVNADGDVLVGAATAPITIEEWRIRGELIRERIKRLNLAPDGPPPEFGPEFRPKDREN